MNSALVRLGLPVILAPLFPARLIVVIIIVIVEVRRRSFVIVIVALALLIKCRRRTIRPTINGLVVPLCLVRICFVKVSVPNWRTTAPAVVLCWSLR